MKKQSILVFAMAVLSLTACKNSSEKSTAESTAADSTATAAAPKAEFKPFDMVEINHAVKDFAVWKKAFDADSSARQASGLSFLVIGKNADNPNKLMVVLEAADVQKAKAFAADPRLKDVMDKNGVISKPEINYFHVLRFNAESKEKQWVVVTHKVKDYDAWLKVFDAEGTEKRATDGLIDVVVARGIDDANTVQLVFDIKDLAKAKAAIASPERKKVMESAGVLGVPKIEFFTSAE